MTTCIYMYMHQGFSYRYAIWERKIFEKLWMFGGICPGASFSNLKKKKFGKVVIKKTLKMFSLISTLMHTFNHHGYCGPTLDHGIYNFGLYLFYNDYTFSFWWILRPWGYRSPDKLCLTCPKDAELFKIDMKLTANVSYPIFTDIWSDAVVQV